MSTQSSSPDSSPDSSPPPNSPVTERQLLLRKKEQHRLQTRLRMARYRERLKAQSEQEQEEALSRARAARARYRERHHAALLDAARSKRHEAYAAKYGQEALAAKLERKRQRQLAKQERPRRRDRVKPSHASTRRVERRNDSPVRMKIVHPYQYVYPCTD